MTLVKENISLDKEKLANLLSSEGPFFQKMPHFEMRDEQKKMLLDVIEAFNASKIAIIEAGTGTGKTLAYLIPAILWAHMRDERILISTNTINLQQQLIHKDIPTILKALKIDMNVALVKGMGNYLCKRKLYDSYQEATMLDDDDTEQIEKILAWGDKTLEGTYADLPFRVKPGIWERVAAESDTCTRDKCPHFDKCHFFKARKKAHDAKIMISNHSLLFVDLSYRSSSGQGLLPDYSRIILDEAHNLEDIALEHLAKKASFRELFRILGRLLTEKGTKKQAGILAMLLQKLTSASKDLGADQIKPIVDKIHIDFASERIKLQTHAADAFTSFATYAEKTSATQDEEVIGEVKQRVFKHDYERQYWQEVVDPSAREYVKFAKSFLALLQGLLIDIENLDFGPKKDEIDTLCHDIKAMHERLNNHIVVIETFLDQEIPDNTVRWIETNLNKGVDSVKLINAALNISKMLKEVLFDPFPTVVLASATLALQKNFTFIKNRFGINYDENKDHVIESIYQSPFDYQKQTLFAVPTNLPLPDHPHFARSAAEAIFKMVSASYGNAFILFTSYSLLNTCFNSLSHRLTKARYHVLKQGQMSRSKLIEQFKAQNRSVLFATDSFWEGVDVSGEALRLVIIVKLPFRVPTEPITQARTELIAKEGNNPFMEFTVPNAVVKFKQGFGRLIRKKTDRGCIVCLDQRLVTKQYGKMFLKSLPECTRIMDTEDEVIKRMKSFYAASKYFTSSISNC